MARARALEGERRWDISSLWLSGFWFELLLGGEIEGRDIVDVV